jgi:hypothetical protein
MKRAKCWLTGMMVLGLALQAAATENGGGANPNGAEGLGAGMLPPPGQYIINYSMYYKPESMKVGDGHTVPIDFHLHAFADTVRFINVTPITVLGGNWAQHIFVPLVWLDVGMTQKSRMKDKNFGIGDIIVDPFIIGWHKPPFHWVVGIDTYIPVGKYNDDSLANIGRNYWTFEPVAGMTYLNEGGQEVSAKLMYDFNLENEQTEYLSGQEFHTDFVVAQHFGPWAAGLGGYWYHQTTNDRQWGAPVNGGNQGRQIAFGPQVSFQTGPVNLSLEWDRELASKNKPQGDKVWFKAIIPL